MQPRRDKWGTAIVYVPAVALPQLSGGIVLPAGYEFTSSFGQPLFFGAPNRDALGFYVTSPDLPPTEPGDMLPELYVNTRDWEAVVVYPYGERG